jgi:hypothetical protein
MKSRTTAAALQETDVWAKARKYLVGWCVGRKRLQEADAAEVVQEAIRQYIAAGKTASDGLEALLSALRSRVNGVLRNQRTSKSANMLGEALQTDPVDLADAYDPERTVVGQEWARIAIGLLLERIQDDELLVEMVMKMGDGVHDPADLAEALGVEIQVVYNARRRLAAHRDAVKASMEKR